MNRDFKLYDAAVAADNAFQAELVRVYGAKKACEKRYQPTPHFEPRLNALGEAKQKADAAWLDEMRRNPL